MRLLQALIVTVGLAAVAAGVGMVFLPAGVVVAGVLLAAAGLFVIDDGRGPR